MLKQLGLKSRALWSAVDIDMAKKFAKRQQQRARTEDASCSGPAAEWFDAEKEDPVLQDYCKSWAGSQWLFVLDVFSFHEGMKKHLPGRTRVSMDIGKDAVRHDLTTKGGVLLMVAMLMALIPGGFVFGTSVFSLHFLEFKCAPSPCRRAVWQR